MSFTTHSFGERTCKCLGCGDGISCKSSLKSHYKFNKQQSLYEYENDKFQESHEIKMCWKTVPM